MPPLLRASSLDQALECSAWIGKVTARDKRLCDEEYAAAEDAKLWGTMVHTWIETGKIRHPLRNSRDKVDAAFAKREEKLLGNRIYKHKLRPTELYPVIGQHEIAMAYNWRHGYSVLNYAPTYEWKESFDQDWITGSTDFCLEDVDGTVDDILWVDDLKTGKWWTKTPKQSAQVKFYAMCIAQHARVPKHGIDLSITHWPKYPASRPPNRRKEVITLEELSTFETSVVEMCFKAVGETKNYNPSPGVCRFCPARFSCLFRAPVETFEWKDKIK